MGRRSTWLHGVGLAWCRINYPQHPVVEVCRLYEEQFGKPVTIGQMRAAAGNHGFKSPKRGQRSGPRIFDIWEMNWLRQNFAKMPRAELRDRFEEEFGRRLKLNQLDHFGTRYDLRGAPNTGRFKPGDPRSGIKTPEQHKAFLEAGKASRFTKGGIGGQKRRRDLPLWTERWRTNKDKRPILLIKVPGPHPAPIYKRQGWNQKTHWVRKAVWVWKQEHGPVPKGNAVVVLDGDEGNCSLDNLECLPRGVLATLNAHGGSYAGPEMNPTRIAVAKLRRAAGERKRKAKDG